MFTRRTATVIMSAPEASCAFTMTDGDEYFPVPTISREANVLPAIVKLESMNLLSTADEVDDLHLIALAHQRVVECRALQDDQVVFDRHPARIDVELSQKTTHG